MNSQFHEFRNHPMSFIQLTTIAMCFAINFLDGMDILAIAFAAPAIGQEWGLGAQQLGILFSAGLAGMMFGSLVVAPLADNFGRRPMVLICLVTITLWMILSAFCYNLEQIVICRIFTGIGVGAMLPSINTHVAEYSSNKMRNLLISILQIGYVCGGAIGGIIAGYLVIGYDWRAIFLFSGILSGLLIPFVFFCFPESIDYLVLKRNDVALEQANKILGRMKQQKLPQFTTADEFKGINQKKLAVLLSSEFRMRTISIWAAYFVAFFALYFVLNLTPIILINAGLSLEMGIGGGVILNVGGVVGSILLGFISTRYSLTNVVSTYILLAVVSMIVFGVIGLNLPILLATAFTLGFFVLGCTVGLYAIVPNLYPPSIRTTGTGWAIGIGRFGAISGPYIGGMLIGQEWERGQYFFVMALPLLLGAMIIYLLGRGQNWSTPGFTV